MTPLSLLPGNATPLERVLEATGAARPPLPVERIAGLWNPATCPAELLGYLAYQLSIDLWDDAWPEAKKRSVCRDAFRLHRLKTTLAGIKAHVALTGATVVKAIRPPARLFLGSSLTPAERERWLESLPQLRLYPFDRRAIAGGAFLSPRQPIFAGRFFPAPSQGAQLYGTRATFYDQGVETEIAFERPAPDVIRLMLPAEGKGAFLGRAHVGRFFPQRSEAAAGVFTVRLSGDLGGFAVAAGLNPVSIEPVRVAQAGTASPAAAFLGRMLGRRYLLPSQGPRLVYDRICISAPDRVAGRSPGSFFPGASRLGKKPFQAELLIEVPIPRQPQRWRGILNTGFLMPTDFSAIQRACRAVEVAKAARDTVLIDTAIFKAVRFGDGRKFGEFRFGELRKAA